MMTKITAENVLERQIMADPAWIEGSKWGKPRPGHPEGAIHAHIAEVLANIDKMYLDPNERTALRLIALIHDTFKYQVDTTKPLDGANHHAMRARRFAEKYLGGQDAILDIIELHDEAYNSYSSGVRKNNMAKAEHRAMRLVKRLGPNVELYVAFYEADNLTGDKSQASVEWFQEFLKKAIQGW